MKQNAFNQGLLRLWLPPKLLLVITSSFLKRRHNTNKQLLRVMKLTIVIMILFLAQVSAATFAQKLTYKKQGATLKQVFAQIRLQTGYHVLYSEQKLDLEKKMDVDFNNTTLDEVLIRVIGDGLAYSIEDKDIFIQRKMPSVLDRIAAAFSSIEVHGRVVDEQGHALAGATVTVKGKNRSVTTDANGRFFITDVDEKATFVISYLGYEVQEIKAKANLGTIQMTMASGKLDEVKVTVNTGYQTFSKERANGSFAIIDTQTLNEQAGTNILQRLDGVTSGLAFSTGKSNGNPQNTTNITIRGLSTINGPLDPLIVLDNFVYEGDIANINPNLIESIVVLKDASAASIWGARAGNGVIVIVTKKGKFNQPLRASFNADVITAGKPNLYDLPKMSSGDVIDVEQQLFNKGYFNDQLSSSPYTALTPAVEVFLNRQKGLISRTDSAAQINALKAVDSRDEYLEYFYHQPVTQQYALNFNGGDKRNSYQFSAAYDNSSNETYNVFKKLNIRAENTFRPIDKLLLNVGVYYTNSTFASGRPAYNDIQVSGRQPGYLSFADQNGNPLSIATKYRKAYTDAAGNGKLLDWGYYPLEDYKHNTTRNDLQEIYANTGLNYQLTDFLKVDLKYQYQKQSTKAESLSDIQSFRARDVINSFSQLNTTTGAMTYIVPLGGIKSISNAALTTQTARMQFNLNKSWADHDLSAIAGAETRQSKNSGSGNTLYGYNEDPLTYSNVDAVNTYPNFITGDYGTISNNPGLSNTVYRFVSVYGNASYLFKKRYTLSASARRDGSNIFGANTNDKWKPLWSAGLGWEISKEGFYAIKWLPYLKLTGTYGHSGNVDLSRSALPVASYSTNAVTNLHFVRISVVNNPELRWEQSAQMNLRIDFSTANQWLSGAFEYYKKQGTDLYGETLYDYTTWGRSQRITKNVAAMEGNGIDVTVQSRNIHKLFTWNTSVLFSYNNNKTTKYYTVGANDISALLSGGSSINPVIGKPLYAVAAYKWGGLSPLDGSPRGYLNGQLSTDYTAMRLEAMKKGIDGNIVYKGAAIPLYFGSLINSFSWKQFSASVNVGYKFGYYLFKPTISYQSLIDQGTGHGDFEDRWQKAGDEKHTDIPSFIYPNNSDRDSFFSRSEANVIQGDHVRLKYINLAYTLPTIARQSLFDHLQLYINVSNLGILWRANKDHVDPDYISSIPVTKTFAIGLRSNF